MANPWLLAGAALSAAAAALHLLIIARGPAWYRFFGAGREIVAMAERGDRRATLITLAIAAVLAGFAAYALSGAGLLPRLPLLRPVLLLITAIYLVRGFAPWPLMALRPRLATPFWTWSSAIVAGYGLVHAAGTAAAWDRL